MGQKVFYLDILTLENEDNTVPWNVRIKFTSDTAPYPSGGVLWTQ